MAVMHRKSVHFWICLFAASVRAADVYACLKDTSITIAADSIGRQAWIDWLSANAFKCDEQSPVEETHCLSLQNRRKSRDDFVVNVFGREHSFRHVRQVSTISEAPWLRDVVKRTQKPDAALILSAGLWNLKWDAPNTVPAGLYAQVSSLLLLLSSEGASPERTLWRTMTPIEHNASFPAHYTPELVAEADAHVASMWRGKGWQVVNVSEVVLSHPASATKGRRTLDGTHYPVSINVGIMEQTLQALCSPAEKRATEETPSPSPTPVGPPTPPAEPVAPKAQGHPKVTLAATLAAFAAAAAACVCAAIYLYANLPTRLSSPAAFVAVHAVVLSAVYLCDVARWMPIVDKQVWLGADNLMFVCTVIGMLMVVFGVATTKKEGGASKVKGPEGLPVPARVVASVAGTPASLPASSPTDTKTDSGSLVDMAESGQLIQPQLQAHRGGLGSAPAVLAPVRESEGSTDSSRPAEVQRKDKEKEGTGADGMGDFFPLQQTLEYKGWMMLGFLAYHYWDVKWAYNPIRVCVAAYLFLTGYGNYCSLSKKGPSLHKLATSLVRINLLPVLVMCVTRKGWMLYYIAPLHTLWTVVVYIYFWLPALPPRLADRVPGGDKVAKLLVLLLLLLIFFELPGTAEIVSWPFSPWLSYCGSLREFVFRSKLDAYASWTGMAFAACIPAILPYLGNGKEVAPATGTEEASAPAIAPRLPLSPATPGKLLAIVVACVSVVIGHAFLYYPMDKNSYNSIHRFSSWAPICAFLVLRNLTPSLRALYVPSLAVVGVMSLELYILQFHVWMAKSAKALVVFLPEMRQLSFLLHTVLFFLLSHASSLSTRVVLKYLDAHAGAAYGAAAAVLLGIAGINALPSACPFT